LSKIIRNIYKKTSNFLSDKHLERYKVARVVSNFLKSQLKTNFVEIDGNKMFLDPLDSLRLSHFGIYEEYETSIVKKIIKKGDVVVDIGANIGYYTLLFAKLVGEQGKVFAFEPESNNFALLQKNLKINGYENVIIIKKAVSDISGKRKLYLNEKNLGQHTTIAPTNNGHAVEVDSIRLDDFFEKSQQKIDFIKIDIEGGEINALKGMSKILKSFRDITLMSEFNPFLLRKFGIDPQEYENLLKDFNFKIYELDGKRKTIIPFDQKRILELHKPDEEYYTNVLCSKNNENVFKLINE